MSYMNNDLFLIDSNILIYSIDSSDKVKHLKAKNILRECWIGKKTYAISLQNLSEFFVISTSKVEKPISKEKSARIIKGLIEFNGFIKLEPSTETIKKALDIAIKEKRSYWDSLIIAIMNQNNISHIFTEDVSGFNIPGINAINPFSK